MHVHKFSWGASVVVGWMVIGCGPSDSGTGVTEATASTSATMHASVTSASTGDTSGDPTETTMGVTTIAPTTDATTESATTEATQTETETDTGTETGEMCSDYQDVTEIDPAVAVKMTNNLPTPVFVQVVQNCEMGVLELAGPDSDEPTPWQLQNCWTCDGAMQDGCVCPGVPCFTSRFLKIEPGVSYVTPGWSGAVFVNQTLPEDCVSESCPAACEQRQQASPGMYMFHVTAGTAISGCEFDCDCLAGEEGWCFIEGLSGEYDDDPWMPTAAFIYPDETSVEISIE